MPSRFGACRFLSIKGALNIGLAAAADFDVMLEDWRWLALCGFLTTAVVAFDFLV
jgi:hypothetical protein